MVPKRFKHVVGREFIPATAKAGLKLRPTKRRIQEAIRILCRGGVIIYPTETAYALGCDARNARAVGKVFRLKGRTTSKTLPVIAASKTMAKALVNIDPVGVKLIARYWPGPLSIVAKARRSAGVYPPHGVIAPDGTIAVRVSSHPVARALSRGLRGPLVSTSANRAGEPACFTAKDALASLCRAPDLVLDAGRLPRRKPSTIVWVADGKIKVLRQGSLYVSQTL